MVTNTVWSPGSPNITNGIIKIKTPPPGTTKNNIQTDWTKLNTNSANRAVKNLEYKVNNLNVVEFRYPTTSDPNGPKTTANSIQEIADDRLYVATYGYTSNTTKLIQDSLRKELTSKADSIGWKSPGASTPAPQQPGQGGTPPPAPTLPGPGSVNNTPNPSESLSFAPENGLRYPKEISTTQDRVKFQAVELLERLNGTPQVNSGFNFTFPKPNLNKVDGPVIIAVQAPISDQNSVDWGPDSVNAIDSALFGVSLDFMIKGNPEQQATDFYKNLLKGAGDYSGRIQKLLAGQAASINNILARTDNVVLNPNLELLFQGPQLRPFTFQFKMSARNQPEADEIRRIINYFKYHMAVREEKGLFLKAPHVFKIQYEKGEGEPHPGINLISPNVRTDKACALTNCSVDYTPLGSYMTYKDGTMVAYTLSLQFQELTPILDTDYNDIYTQQGAPMSIGY